MKKNNHRGSSHRSSHSSSARGHAPQRGAVPTKAPEIPKDWRAVVGNHAIHEALSVSKSACKKLWVRATWESSEELREIVERSRKAQLSIETKSDGVLDKLASTHQGAVLYVDSAPAFNLEGLQKKESAVVLMLDGLEDPHNLGAIMRTSWLMGADAIMTPEDRAVGLTPIVHKVACGGVEHVPLERVNNFTRHAEALKEQGFWVYGLSHKATKTLWEMELPDKVVWAIGAEDKGLRTTTEKICDELVSIPQVSAGASYNASVAAAIALAESRRQIARRAKNKKT